jgi:hypothetical protein
MSILQTFPAAEKPTAGPLLAAFLAATPDLRYTPGDTFRKEPFRARLGAEGDLRVSKPQWFDQEKPAKFRPADRRDELAELRGSMAAVNARMAALEAALNDLVDAIA